MIEKILYMFIFSISRPPSTAEKRKTNAIDYIMLKSVNEGSDQRIHKKEAVSLF